MDQCPYFDELQYQALYSDLKGLNSNELQQHWLNIGCKEGRHYTVYQAYPDFDEPVYRALYDDLKELSNRELQIHWLTIGRKEGRHYTVYQAYLDFYEPHYRALYEDVQNLSSGELHLHWLNIGRKEGRHYSIYHAYPDFDEQIYAALYDDLLALTSKELQLHWLTVGIKENRTYDFYKMYPSVNEIEYQELYTELKDASIKTVRLHWLYIGKAREFREDHYQAMYDDLSPYTGEQLRNHWVITGKKQGRKCNLKQITPEFNENHYRELYDDVKTLTSDQIKVHWIRVGRLKNRHCSIYQAYPSFEPEIYQALYDDLKHLNKEELEIHWLRTGRVKRRKTTIIQYFPDFNEKMYQSLYDDLTHLSSKELELHWLNIGRKNGRTYHFHVMHPDFNESNYRKEHSLQSLSLLDLQYHWLKIGIKKEIRYFDRFYPTFDDDMYRQLHNMKWNTPLEVRLDFLHTGRTDKCTIEFDEEMYRALYGLSALSTRDVQLDFLKSGKFIKEDGFFRKPNQSAADDLNGRSDKFTLEFDEEMYRALYGLSALSTRDVQLDFLKSVRPDKFTLEFDEEMYRQLYSMHKLTTREVQLDFLRSGRTDKFTLEFDDDMYRELHSMYTLTTRDLQLDFLRSGRTDKCTVEFDIHTYQVENNLHTLTPREVQLEFLRKNRIDIQFDEEMYRALYGLEKLTLRDLKIDFLRMDRTDTFTLEFDEEMYRIRYDLNELSKREVQLDFLRSGRTDTCDTDFDEEMYRFLYNLESLSTRDVQLDFLRSGKFIKDDGFFRKPNQSAADDLNGRTDECNTDFDEEMYRALYGLQEWSYRKVQFDYLRSGRTDKFTLYFNEEMYRKLYEELQDKPLREVQIDWLVSKRPDSFELLYPNFNEDHYREFYSDVKNMTSEQMRENWLTIGRKSGRHDNIYRAFPDFNSREYQALYDDLKNLNERELEIHWLRSGRIKRRKCSVYRAFPHFNEEHYKALYDDVKMLSGEQIRMHWIRVGRIKNRYCNIYDVYKDFNPRIYRALYDDLKELSNEEVEIHWLRSGRLKRRKYKIELVYPEFNEDIHRILFEELKNASPQEIQIHWLELERGKRKKFSFSKLYPDFDAGIYRMINPELMNMTVKELEIHWLSVGRNTGKQYSVYQMCPNFNPRIYRLLNVELESLSEKELERHWLEVGSKKGLKYNMYDLYPDFNIEKYKELVLTGVPMSSMELELHWLECGRYSDLYYSMYSDIDLSNRNKILLVIQNDVKKGIYKHTDILKRELGAHVMTLDETSTWYIRFNANYKKYDYVVWQNTFIKLPIKQNYQKNIYVVHSDSEMWPDRKKECVKNNDSLIDLYIFVNDYLKESFEKNIVAVKNGIVIENQISKINNTCEEIAKLYVSCGSYRETKNYYTLIDKFSVLDQSNQLEIYGNIVDEEYFNELKQYVEMRKLTNVKLLDYRSNYTERLREAEYFCLFSKNERDSYSLLEAMALGKKIICGDDCVTTKQLKYYRKRVSSFTETVSMAPYVFPDYVFIEKMRHAIVYNQPLKRYVDNIVVTEETDNRIISKEIKYGLKHLELTKGVSFLLRIKNEQLYILTNIFQIYQQADEIIIVDNGSTDETLEIIDYFNLFYKKVFVYYYKISIHNVTQNEGNYKKQIGTFYNWSLSKVTKNNVIKWDGDFESTEEVLKEMIDKYNLRERTDQFALWFSGITKFYGKYMNVSSYYDEYRCFSKLNGFMWVDTNHCESAGNYVKDGNTKRYVIGYDTDDNPVWLSNVAKCFDYVRKPVFIENKNYKDFKEYTLDERCRNDNMILTTFRDMPAVDKKKEIIFIVILERANIGGVETVSKTLENYLLYFGKDVRYILLKPTCAVDNKKYYSLDSFMDMLDLFRDNNLFIYTSYQVETDQINKNGNVKFIGISHSDISYYNKYFTENSGLYNKIIVVNNSCYQKYKILNVDNVVLMRNNIEILTVDHKREFDPSCIRVLFFSRTSYDKNVIMLMDVIDRLWSEGIKIYLDIYSDLDKTTSYYYNMLEHKECITIKPPTNNKNIYLDYDLCVLPSVSEGCSMNVLESINHEVPILCSKNVGNEEIIEEHFPMFELIGLDCCKDDLYVTNYNKLLTSIGYKIEKNDLGLELMKSGREVYEQNVEEMKRKIQMVIDNYSFYKNQTLTLKNNIKDKFFNIKQYMLEMNNLLSDNTVIIDYPVN